MSIYIFSILSGYEMGGVDAAQARRGKMLEKSGEKVTYVFTDVPDEYYIRRYRNLGISDDKMLSAHAFLTGKTELSGRFSASDYIAKYQRVILMLSRLVDTFFSRTSRTMLLYGENHSISVA